MSEQFAFIEDAEQEAIDNLVATTRQLVEAVLVVEFRLASVAALTERFGARYGERATIELQGASDRLKIIEEVSTIDELLDVTPGPIRQLLADSRADLLAARDRIDILRGKAEDIVGRRIALVVEALTAPGSALEATYGREHRPRSRVVSGVL